MLALGEAPALFVAGHREPVFEQQDAGAHEHAFQFRRLAHELEVVVRRTEAHDALDAGPVVPGAVEHHDLAARRQMLDVALEIPLRGFALGRLLERDDAGATRIEMLHEPLDGAALAGGVAAFENQDDLLAGLLDPFLDLEQFDLQFRFVFLIDPGAHPFLVRIFAGLEGMPDRLRVMALDSERVQLLADIGRLGRLGGRRPAAFPGGPCCRFRGLAGRFGGNIAGRLGGGLADGSGSGRRFGLLGGGRGRRGRRRLVGHSGSPLQWDRFHNTKRPRAV